MGRTVSGSASAAAEAAAAVLIIVMHAVGRIPGVSYVVAWIEGLFFDFAGALTKGEALGQVAHASRIKEQLPVSCRCPGRIM